MQVKCDFCGAMIDDNEEACPNCGAPNTNMKRMTDGTPKTIEELKQWYEARNLPPQDVTRFFIGVNYMGPRAFGIYQDGDEFVVYKNKDTGERAIRYRGNDEAYAVNELYLKLKSEILNQKARNQSIRSSGGGGKSGNGMQKFVVTVALVGIIGGSIFASTFGNASKYYKYNNDVYCYYNDNYYIYDYDTYDYTPAVSIPYEIKTNGDAYTFDSSSNTWNSNYSFTDSSYYTNNIEPYESSNSDSDYDWDSGDSWDSGGSDWGSDW